MAAEDRRYTQTYTVTVTREPRVSISVVTAASVTEGGDVVFRVTRSHATDADLVVNLTVTDAGDVIDPSDEGPQTLTIEADEASADYTVTSRNNRVFAARSAITVAVVGGDGYTPSTTGATRHQGDPRRRLPRCRGHAERRQDDRRGGRAARGDRDRSDRPRHRPP